MKHQLTAVKSAFLTLTIALLFACASAGTKFDTERVNDIKTCETT